MSETRVSFFNKLVKSISDFKSYVYFSKLSTGSAFSYLLLITLLFGTMSLIRPIYDYTRGINDLTNSFKESVRDFTFNDGELTVEGDMPIILDSGNETFIIDTSGKTDKQALDKYDKGILITKDTVIQKKSVIQTTETSLKDIKGFTINKASVEKFLPILKWFNIAILIFGLIFFFIGKMITSLIVALLGMIVAAIQKVAIGYGSLYKLSLYALTLPIIISVALGITNLKFPHFYKLYCLSAVVYLWFAIKAIKESQLQETVEQDNY